MKWVYKDLLTGVLAAIIGGAILTGITQRGGWSMHGGLCKTRQDTQ
jgi:hypothetical protein